MNKEGKKYANIKRMRRASRARANINGTAVIPRLSVFRSNQYVWAQVINDDLGKTLVSVSEKEIMAKGTKTERAKVVGKFIAEKCLKSGILQVVFDRGSARYHGRVKFLAESARENGLKF